MPLLITFLAGLSIALGTGIIRFAPSPDRIRQISFSLALGALLALLLFDLFPEIMEFLDNFSIPAALFLILVGVLLLKCLDLFIPDHKDTAVTHDHGNAAHIGVISSLAIILHNIVEGMTVYSLSLTSLHQGAVFAFGISLHNIPMGMLIYSSMAEKKSEIRRILLTIVTLSTLLGGLIMHMVSQGLTKSLMSSLLCLASGMIIYIVFFELFPHVLRTRSPRLSAAGAALGFLLVFVSCIIAE